MSERHKPNINSSENAKFLEESIIVKQLSYLFLQIIKTRKKWLTQNMADPAYRLEENNLNRITITEVNEKLQSGKVVYLGEKNLGNCIKAAFIDFKNVNLDGYMQIVSEVQGLFEDFEKNNSSFTSKDFWTWQEQFDMFPRELENLFKERINQFENSNNQTYYQKIESSNKSEKIDLSTGKVLAYNGFILNIDENGLIINVTEGDFDIINSFCNGFAVVQNGKKYGYIDTAGKVFGGVDFDNAYDFGEDGVAIIDKQGKKAYLNEKGEILPYGFTSKVIHNFTEGFGTVCIDGMYGFIDKSGNILNDKCEFEVVNAFFNGLSAVKKDGKYGYINKSGEVTGQGFVYDVAWRFVETSSGYFAVVSKDGKYGYVNTNGELMWDGLSFDFAFSFENDIATFTKNNRSWYIDSKGEQFPFPKNLRHESGSFESGFCSVTLYDDDGYPTDYSTYIDTSGNVLDQVVFNHAHEFVNNFAMVSNLRGSKIPSNLEDLSSNYDLYQDYTLDLEDEGDEQFVFGLLNTSGNVIGEGVVYDDVEDFVEGLALVIKNDQFGFLSENGKYFAHGLGFDYAESFSNGWALIEKAGKRGYINTSGDILWLNNNSITMEKFTK
jgi:WG containing repeat